MSGIAEVLLTLGYAVSGSDLAESAATARLRALGAEVRIGHAAAHVAGADVVVVSSAVKEDNPEVAAARAGNIPVVPRALMLAELMRLRQGIAVAGTHGKTTTTSLVASVLAEAGMDPTFVIGGRLEAAGAHARLGAGEFIVVEADESDASFLYLHPTLAVVTNIDADHMDTYGHSMERLRAAFVEFLQRLPFYGTAVLCADDPNVRAILPSVAKPVTTYGLSPDAQVRAREVRAQGAQMSFRVLRAGADGPRRELAVTLNLPGVHNVRNALAAIAVATELGVADETIARALAEFKGVGRRFQRYEGVRLASGATVTVVDDYGHHPAEIEATLAAARGAYPGRRIVLAFQPHRYSRTRDCFEAFVRVLSTADALLLAQVYPAGEPPIPGADGRALAQAVRERGRIGPRYLEHIAELPAALAEVARDGDVVLLMGAGSIGTVVSEIVQAKAEG
jgi:UDP-N-acetylmuramate--alanine ligase